MSFQDSGDDADRTTLPDENRHSCEEKNISSEPLSNEVDKEVEEIMDEVVNHGNLVVGCAKQNDQQLEESANMKVVTIEENLQENTSVSNIQAGFCEGVSAVEQILLEILDQVAEKLSNCENMKTHTNQDEHEYLTQQTSNSGVDTSEGVVKSAAEGRTHGLKRSHDESQHNGEVLRAHKDSSYIMTLLEEELNVVNEQLKEEGETKLVDYDSDSSDSAEDSSDESSSSESSSDSESTSSEESSIDERMVCDKIGDDEDKVHINPPKTKDELLLKDLPPEPLLDIVLPDNVNMMQIGVITSIVESIVVIRALPKTPAVDADTLLFLENRKCLGKVFEIFGPVQCPFYSVRFNTPEDFTKVEIKTDLTVFFAPEELDFTKLIFTSEIEKLKGSDASWKHDQEPPDELQEFSDDEEEVKAKALKKQARRANKPASQEQNKSNGLSSETVSQGQTNKPQKPKVSEHRHTWQGRGRGRNIQGNHPRQPFSGLLTHPHAGSLHAPSFGQHPLFHPHGHHAPTQITPHPPSLPLQPPLRPGQYYQPPPLPPPQVPPPGYPSRPQPPYADMHSQPPPPLPPPPHWMQFNYRPSQQ